MQNPNTNLNLIDLTYLLTSDIPHWSGQNSFKSEIIVDYDAFPAEAKFRVQHLSMAAGIGTHMDAPAHCFPNAKTIDEISIKNLFIAAVVIDVSNKADETYSVSPEDIQLFENNYGTINKNTFVIVRTGWEKHWNQPKYRNDLVFPSISKQAAELLLQRDIVGIGIDTLSPDRPDDNFPVHQLILGNDKYIIENIANLASMPAAGASIIALPLKIKGGTEAPVRLFAIW